MRGGARPSPAFELVGGLEGGEAVPEIFGLWSVTAPPPAGPVSFDVASPPPADVPVWRVNLPAEARAADEQLRRAETQVRDTQAALSGVPGRLNRLAAHVGSKSAVGISFDAIATHEALPPAEAQVLHWLEAEPAGLDSSQVSFGLGETFAAWGPAQKQFEAFVERLTRLLVQYAWVETRIEDDLMARTIVGWGGDAGTLWREGLGAGQESMHCRTLALALTSRATWIQTITTVTQTALKLTLLAATPGGAVMTLPVAWKFVRQVLAEIEQHQERAG